MKLGSPFSDARDDCSVMTDDADPTAREDDPGQTARSPRKMGRQFEAGAVDIAEWQSNFVIRMDLPGVDGDGLSLDVDDARLEITAERNRNPGVPIERHLFRERMTARVDRSISLPSDVDGSEMTAEYDCGVLTVVLPKA